MSLGKTTRTLTQFAAKKLLGKAHTNNTVEAQNETTPSNVSMAASTIFADSVPTTPPSQYFAPSGSVERVMFRLVALGSPYDADASTDGGGDESQNFGQHAYQLQLPPNYQTTSSNPAKGTGFFVNDQVLHKTGGRLQLVVPSLTSADTNNYHLRLYSGEIDEDNDLTNKILDGSTIDWQIDYYAGVIFVQDFNPLIVPVSASAYLYVGDFVDDKINEISSSGGGGSNITVKDEGSSLSTAAVSFDFVGAGVTATKPSGENITVTIPGGVIYSRDTVVSTITASITSSILGVSGTAAIDIRLPSAGDYDSGQFFTIKDEAGHANTNNITIRTSGSQTIDGESSIVLESPYAAVNLYSNGTDKFFIY